MPTIRRLADSCVSVTTDAGTTLFDPGFFTFESGAVDLDTIGDVQRVLITHEHADHVSPAFVRWLVDRGDDVAVHANEAVVHLLARHDIAASFAVPQDCSVEDVIHEPIPNGATPPNRAWTLDDVFTHPGDSYAPTRTAPVMALPLVTPWGSATGAVTFARGIAPQQVVPVHDFYLSASGRQGINDIVDDVLADAGIELLRLDWGDEATI